MRDPDLKELTVCLESEASTSFRCQKAANSLDLDVKKKLRHELKITADIETPFSVGVVVGASGSGKTTLADSAWGINPTLLDPETPVIDQFPDDFTYEDCVKLLCGVGLSQVPCWIRPAVTLSNGQRERAEIALQMANAKPGALIVIDEWTSVVDRTVAKVMSHTIAKWARKNPETRLILLTCHYDVMDWLQPDWIIDCNKEEYIDQRGSKKNERKSYNFTSGKSAENHGGILASITI